MIERSDLIEIKQKFDRIKRQNTHGFRLYLQLSKVLNRVMFLLC
uniref:Uncharacterized protein n=1 Tax=Candidatus Methanophaga sp. ANME-1 ERB7 TaxID=2759913 RepID=A0A7G9ZCU8_9EURY|nr:hypothetical protein OJKMNAAM_00003 [Methanosarcinales archaeon ANME-1 ERB7]